MSGAVVPVTIILGVLALAGLAWLATRPRAVPPPEQPAAPPADSPEERAPVVVQGGGGAGPVIPK